MSLFSAFDDFLQTSVRAVPGIFRKLDYISGLRSGEGGQYLHWGLMRVHGEREAQQAMAEAHRQVLSEVLSTPIRLLLEGPRELPGETGQYLGELHGRRDDLLPANSNDGSIEHFSSVLHALLLLAHSRQETTLPVS